MNKIIKRAGIVLAVPVGLFISLFLVVGILMAFGVIESEPEPEPESINAPEPEPPKPEPVDAPPVTAKCPSGFDKSGETYTYDPDDYDLLQSMGIHCGRFTATCPDEYERSGESYTFDVGDDTDTRLLYNSIVIGDPYGVQGVLEYTESLCGRYITLEERRRNANTAPVWVSFRRKASWYVMVVKTSFDVPQFAMDLYVEGQSFCNPGTIRGGHPIEMSCAAFEGNPASVTSIYAEVDRRGIYECYKQDNRASWACFKD